MSQKNSVKIPRSPDNDYSEAAAAGRRRFAADRTGVQLPAQSSSRNLPGRAVGKVGDLECSI